MAQTHIEQFFSMAFKDPQLVATMQQGAGGPESFIGNAVKIAKEHGYKFSATEATAWIEQQQKTMAPGELSNAQLEGVAGGVIGDEMPRDVLKSIVTSTPMQTIQEMTSLIGCISKAMHDASQSTISNIKA